MVQGVRREVDATKLSAAEVRRLPGAFGDAFRAVEALPSVTPVLSGFPYFFVRGAPPNNNGYFLDGVRLPTLFHVGLGPSVIHPGLLERVDFFPGPAPARLGGFAGALVAGGTREPRTLPHAEANLRLVDAGALVETPFADGRGSALLAGRYGYPGPVLSAISEVRLGYWDYQSRLRLRASEHDSLTLFAFGSHDYLAHVDMNGVTVEDLATDFHRIDLAYERALDDGKLRVAATLGHDSQGANPSYLSDRSLSLRVELEERLGRALRLRCGAEGRIDDYRFRQEAVADPRQAPVPSSVNPPPRNLGAVAHAELSWRPLRSIEVTPGVRAAIFDSSRALSVDDSARIRTTLPAVEPRFSLRVSLAPGVAFRSSFGVSHQYPALRVGSLPAVVAAGAGFSASNARLQRTLQASHGLELALPAELTMTVSAYLSRSWGLTDLTAECIRIQPPSAPIGQGPRADDPWFCPNNAPVRGHAYGLELLLRRSLSERLSGMVSYTLSRSVRESHFLRLDGTEAVATVPSEFDRTHLLNAVLSYELGRGWRVGSRLVFYSGAPYSKLVGNLAAPPYNAYRDPAFVRLDVRLEKRWQVGPEQWWAFVLEGQNVTLSKEANTMGLDCRGDITPSAYTTQCTRGKIGPIALPSVGLEAFF
ncbi:MAG: TonB-dependent receptor [Polyangiaceae bacterium]